MKKTQKNNYPSSPKNFGTYNEIYASGRPIPIIQTGGTYYDMGLWLGRLLAPQFQDREKTTVDNYINIGISQEKNPKSIRYSIMKVMHAMTPFLTEAFNQEVAGRLDGCEEVGKPLEDRNFFKTILALTEMGERRCCMFAAQPPATQGHTYQLRQVDQVNQLDYHHHPIIIIRHPQDEQGNPVDIPYVDVNFMGGIGTHTGINSKGLCISQVSIDLTHKPTLNGKPFFLILQDLLQKCKNSLEAQQMLFWSTRTTSETIIISDPEQREDSLQFHLTSPVKMFTAKPGEPINLDYITAKDFKYYEPLEGIVYWAGIYELLKMKSRHVTSKHLHSDLMPFCGKIDIEKMFNVAKKFGHDQTILSAIYDTTAMEMWVAFAQKGSQATKQEYIHLDLKRYFKR